MLLFGVGFFFFFKTGVNFVFISEGSQEEVRCMHSACTQNEIMVI